MLVRAKLYGLGPSGLVPNELEQIENCSYKYVPIASLIYSMVRTINKVE